MSRKVAAPGQRVQVYFEDARVAQALADEAAASGGSISRAAERVIARGLARRLAGDPEDRLLALERAVRDHGRSMARDMTFLQELMAQFARELFTVLPERPADRDPLLQAAVEVRVRRFIDDTIARIARASLRDLKADAKPETASSTTVEPEARTFEAVDL
ncbi:hypothetical protein ACO2Q0_20610 [Phenylobacterium sp. VNQ135]|uniref:hypothetical protein n=1 Tax=Phenylobacterium sp. VNQ135 TaxID=3400922 RepID=UPI003C00B5BE